MKKKKILFVCLGNICRSPAAEAVMNFYIKKNKLEDKIECDSAGTANYHVGEKADPRMIKEAEKRKYVMSSIARQFNPRKDFEEFDYIIVMDDSNYENILILDDKKAYTSKVSKMINYCSKFKVSEVSDPYYGGEKGFNLVLDVLEDACQGLIKKL